MAGIRGDGFISGAGWEAALLTAVLYEVPSSVRHLEIRYIAMTACNSPSGHSQTVALPFFTQRLGWGRGKRYGTCSGATKSQTQASRLVLPSSHVYIFNHIFALLHVVELRPVPR